MPSSLIKKSIPAEYGFTMPAEWALHRATWTSWPFDEDMWYGHLKSVRGEFTNLVKTIAAFEPVHLLLRDDECEQSAKAALKDTPGVTFHRIPLDDIWFRDNGPTFVKNSQGEVSFVRWKFNAWGEKYDWEQDAKAPEYVSSVLNKERFEAPMVMEGGAIEVNGQGLGLTTASCLMSPKRNPTFSREKTNEMLKDYLGIEKLIWLEDGLEDDHTDGHIDTIVRFVNARTIVCSMTDDESDKNYHTMNKNWDILKNSTDAYGGPLEIIPLVLPKNRTMRGSTRLPTTYANFYIGNGFVVVPQYNDPHDCIAMTTLRELFPKHQVIGLSSIALIQGGGSFHCVTQQEIK